MSRGEPADVLGAVDDLELAVGLDVAGVAGLDEAVGGQRLGRLVGLAIVADEHARRFELHLAIPGDAQFDIRRRRPDGVGAHGAVGLRRHVKKRLGLTVELLEVQPQRAIEREQVGADRFPRRIGDADPGKAEDIFQRRVDQSFAERVMQPRRQGNRLPLMIRSPHRLATPRKCRNIARLIAPASSIRIITRVSNASKTRGGAK